MPQYWLLKTEPSTYSIGDLERERRTTWDGIRNALALINLRAMHPGDGLLIYHSGKERAIVGRGSVESAPRTTGKVTVVDVRFEARLAAPVTLAQITGDQHAITISQVIGHRLANTHPATAMPLCAAQQFTQPIDGPLKGRDHNCVGINCRTLKRIGAAQRLQMRRFRHHRQGVKQHKARKMGGRPGQGARAKLGKDMFLRRHTITGDCHHPMPSLGAAIVANDRMCAVVAREKINNRAFAGIAKAQIDGEQCLLHGEALPGLSSTTVK